jgi:hypothetical protein
MKTEVFIMESAAKLLDCPFCGGIAKYHTGVSGAFYIMCSNNDCAMLPETPWSNDKQGAVNDWNRRANNKDSVGTSTNSASGKSGTNSGR